jgi:hypothetical protein
VGLAITPRQRRRRFLWREIRRVAEDDLREVSDALAAREAREVDAGRAPDLRRTIVDGRPQPYWRSPVHAGYFGRRGDTLDDLILVAVTPSFGSSGSIGLFDWLDDLLDPTDLL